MFKLSVEIQPAWPIVGLACLSLLGGCDRRDADQPWNLGETRTVAVDGVVSSACSSAPGTLSIVLPLGVELDRVALGACASLTIGDRAIVRSAKTSAGRPPLFLAITSAAGAAHIGSHTRVPSVYALGRGPLRIDEEAAVAGFVKASSGVERVGSTAVDLDAIVNAPRDCERRTWTTEDRTTPHRAGQDVDTAGASAAPFEPGQYGNIRVGAGSALVLRSGQYVIDALRVEAHGALHINNTLGPVFVWVRSALVLRGPILTYFAGHNVAFGYAGTAPPELAVAFQGTLIAPNALVRLPATREPHVGSFFARDIEVDPDAVVEHLALASPDLVPPAPDVVCADCGREMQKAALACRRVTSRAEEGLRARERQCAAGCRAMDRAPSTDCMDECRASVAAQERERHVAAESCLRTVASACAQAERPPGYQPGACLALHYDQER